ncbi:hypothetical protein [Clostridium saccharoperbutylacetonicum]|uniref:hypothetical protein n=1 Tax=Clostridium saccharoperbutylacetonicum TaxID=36745 RepID=UPI0039E837ED
MKLTLADIKDNLEFNDGGIPEEKIFSFLEENIQDMEFTCIDYDVKYEIRSFKDDEFQDHKEEWYRADINIDDDGNFTLEDSDNTPIEITVAICNDKKSSSIQYFD